MITIDIHPNVFSGDFLGSFVMSWHGFYSFVAVAVAVVLVGRWAVMRGIDPDAIYSIAIWAIVGGVIGARFVHVIDNWDVYQQDPARILAVWSGGIGLWGGIIGGFIGGAVYAYLNHHPVGVIADMTAPALAFAQSIGRIGDIINGEHCANATSFFLGMQWTHEATTAGQCPNGSPTSGNFAQPVVLYEIFWNSMAMFIVWKLRGRIKPDGMLFALYVSMYAVGRFLITFLREDRVWALGMQEAHYIALAVLVVTVPLLIAKARFTQRVAFDPAAVSTPGTRAQRRRRSRTPRS